MANLLPLPIFKKLKLFFRKTHLNFLKNRKFERFQKFYSFSCILRQICDNLRKKNRRREQLMLACLLELNWQTSGKKINRPI